MATGIERFYEEAAYLAALVLWLVEHKSDHEADAEIGDILLHKPFMSHVVIGVLMSVKVQR